MLVVNGISGGYNQKDVVQNISFDVKCGEMFGIIGPNGSGKTTLIKIISRILEPRQGEIYLNKRQITDFSAKEFAQQVAVLPQHTNDSFSYTVIEAVSLGRYAHQKGLFNTWTSDDEKIVKDAMEKTGVIKFANKLLSELSGGERQRVFLAQALAQQPKVLLLDEPTNHLDLSYQKGLLDLLRKLTDEQQLTVLAIFHDLNLASLYCDRLLLLNNGTTEIVGNVSEVLNEKLVEQVYETAIDNHPHPKIPRPQLILLPDKSYRNESDLEISEKNLLVNDELIALTSPTPLRTISSSVGSSGIGWYTTFVNRQINENYNGANQQAEMEKFLLAKGYQISNTVGMMTTHNVKDVVYRLVHGEGFSVFAVVTVSINNKVNAPKGKQTHPNLFPGEVNLWLIINGHLSEVAFIQSIITATEAKVKVMSEQQLDILTPEISERGLLTNNTLIAASQHGLNIQTASSASPLGQTIRKAVFESVITAIQRKIK